MKQMMKLACLICLLLFNNNCERRSLSDLEDLNEYAELELRIAWSVYDQNTPEDGTVMIYKRSEQETLKNGTKKEFLKAVIFGKDCKATVRLPQGEYAFIVANNKPGEESTFFAQKYSDYDSVFVRLADIAPPSYDHPEANNIFVSEPEFLAVDSKDKYIVTAEMINETKRIIKSKSKSPVDVIYFYPKQITRNVSVEIKVEGLHYLKSAEVIANGGYRDIYLSTSQTTKVLSCKLFRITEIEFYPNDLHNGYIRGYFKTFGAGNVNGVDRKKSTKQTGSSIYFTLFSTLKDKDKTIVATSFDVTEQYNNEGSENHNIKIQITDVVKLPDIEIEGGSGSGFNPGVGGWGEGGEIEVPIGKK